MLNSEQVRAARALLRWEQKDLAGASAVSLPTIKRLETQKGKLVAQDRTVDAIKRALEEAGITFIADGAASAAGGPGVRLSAPEDNS